MSGLRDNSGTAFPESHPAIRIPGAGLTKREWFAAMALVGLVDCSYEGVKHGYAGVALECVKFADALLKELGRAPHE